MSALASSFTTRRLTYLYDLLYELVARDIKLRYKRSALGVAWSLLNPLGQLLVFYFVFDLLLPLHIPNYVSFLFTGILAWGWFHTSLLLATGSVVENRELSRRPNFPTAILPIVTITSHLVHFLLALPILLIFLAMEGTPLTISAFALPLVIALQFVFTLGLAFLVAAAHVTFRDTQYLLTIILQLFMFLTPVFYDYHTIPALDQTLYGLNPMVHLLDAYRAILLYGVWPDPAPLLILAALSTVLLVFGYSVFMRASYRFVEEL